MIHETEDVVRAVDAGEPGGMRVIGRCRCGWRTRPTLTARTATRELIHHIDVAAAD